MAKNNTLRLPTSPDKWSESWVTHY
jgi:hypothetical protein